MRTPYFQVDEALLIHNLEILKGVMDRTGCKILLAQKAFSMFSVYPLMAKYLSGTTASGLYEAKLGKEHFSGEVHVYSPAFREDEIDEILDMADHIVFNTPNQVKKYGSRAKELGVHVLLRVNPECSTQEDHAIYDPCSTGSRMGTTLANLDPSILPMLDGFHFHTLCEQNSDALFTTVQAFKEKFGPLMKGMKYLNLGGGHHITREDYDIPLLESIILDLQSSYGVEVYLEPGEAVVYRAGFLMTRVLELMDNGMNLAVLDTSAACHMPDVIEMPYRPPLKDSGEEGEKAYTYRLGGPTCLAGDVIGTYSFDKPLQEGSLLCFEDMALYTMVKTNTFNGMGLPSIVLKKSDGTEQLIKSFGYEDFKSRLS